MGARCRTNTKPQPYRLRREPDTLSIKRELGTRRPLLGKREIHSNDAAAAYFVMKAAAAASKIEDNLISFEAA